MKYTNIFSIYAFSSFLILNPLAASDSEDENYYSSWNVCSNEEAEFQQAMMLALKAERERQEQEELEQAIKLSELEVFNSNSSNSDLSSFVTEEEYLQNLKLLSEFEDQSDYNSQLEDAKQQSLNDIIELNNNDNEEVSNAVSHIIQDQNTEYLDGLVEDATRLNKEGAETLLTDFKDKALNSFSKKISEIDSLHSEFEESSLNWDNFMAQYGQHYPSIEVEIDAIDFSLLVQGDVASSTQNLAHEGISFDRAQGPVIRGALAKLADQMENQKFKDTIDELREELEASFNSWRDELEQERENLFGSANGRFQNLKRELEKQGKFNHEETELAYVIWLNNVENKIAALLEEWHQKVQGTL